MRFLGFLLATLTVVLPNQFSCAGPPIDSHEKLDIQGWTIWLNKELRSEHAQETRSALNLMNAQLKRVVDAIPPVSLAKLRAVPIWVNPRYKNERPRCEYHPGARWLKDNGRDPRMAKAVEVSNVSEFEFEDRRMPYLMLHELAHAYHDQVLGFDHPNIEEAFETAKDAGIYKRVKRFTGRKMVNDKAYALSNAKEYFAENTEAYFGRNDFFPFDRSELENHDPKIVKVLKKVWGDDQSNQPFVKFKPEVQNYLKRVQSGKSEFSWREDWSGGFSNWQKNARTALEERIGLTRIANSLKGFAPTVELEKAKPMDGYSRIRGSIQTEPDTAIPFYLLLPEGEGPFPLAICPHGHHGKGWHFYAGVFSNDEERNETLARDGNVAEQLAKRGFAAIAPATRGLANETAITDVKNRHGKRACRAQLMHCLISGRTPIGERVWDMQQILNWAVKHSKVDSKRVVMLGNSGGGVVTAYAAAIDTRIQVAIPSCSFTSVTSSTGFIFHCDCCAIPGILDWGDLADVGGLIAPRSLLIVHGPKDGLHHKADVDRNAEQVKKIFAAGSAVESLQQTWGDGGHKFYPKQMWDFIDRQLPNARQ